MKRFSTLMYRALLTASVAAMASQANAQAQSSTAAAPASTAAPVTQAAAGGGIEEIIVTARRKEEQLQSVPVSIAAFSGAALVSLGVKDVRDLMSVVPGLNTVPGSVKGFDSPIFAIRGQINPDPTITADPSVGLYFGEVPWARVQGVNSSFLDLQDVQVLKGPQGTLFGRNSDAGAILVTPHAPTNQFEGYGKFTAGNFGLLGAEAVVNIPVNDKLAIRVAGSRQQRDGYFTRVNAGHEKASDVNTGVLRTSVKFTPTDNFTTTLLANYTYSHDHGTGDKLIQVSSVSPGGIGSVLRPFMLTALAQTQALGKYEGFTEIAPGVTWLPALLSAPGVPAGLAAPFSDQIAKAQTYAIQDTSTLHLGSSGILGDASLKNIAGWRSVKSFSYGGASTATPFFNYDSVNSVSAQQFSEELQLQGIQGKLNYVVGAFFFTESGEDKSLQEVFSPILSLINNRVRNTSYSIFGHGSYDLSFLLKGLSVSGGARWNVDERYWNDQNRVQTAFGATTYRCQFPTTTTIFASDNQSLCNYPNRITFREPTWDIGVNYNFTPHNIVYASVAHGYRSGGFNVSATTNTAARPYLPERDTNYEIGSKNDFKIGQVAARLNLAIYHMDYTDLQRTLFTLVNGAASSLTVNVAQARIDGGEVDFTVKPTSALETTLSYAHTVPKYTKFVDNVLDKGVLYPINVAGSEFRDISRDTITATLRYTFDVPERYGRPTLTFNYSYHTSFFTTSADINNAPCSAPSDPNPVPTFYPNCLNHEFKLPGYALSNLRLDWLNMMGRGVDGSLFINNLFDKYYYLNAVNVFGSVGTTTATPGPPRMFGVELRVPFGGS